MRNWMVLSVITLVIKQATATCWRITVSVMVYVFPVAAIVMALLLLHVI